MKKVIYMMLCFMLLFVSTSAFAETKAYETYTLGEIQNILESYLDCRGEYFYEDPEAMYEYAVDVLLGSEEYEIEATDNFALIKEYLVQYKLVYEDYLYCSHFLEQGDLETAATMADKCNCIYYDAQKNIASFELSGQFLETTIEDIVERNKCMYETTNNAYINNVMAANASYSGSTAASYAQRYAKNYNKAAYPSYSIISGGDCTNFVSQCLFAGGIPKVGSKTTEGVYSSTTQWYCICTYDPGYQSGNGREYAVSTSWIRAIDFNAYMTSVAKSKSVKSSESALNSSCSVGDIVQLLSDAGTPYHSVIISQKTTSGAKYCGHTYDKLNEPISTIFSDANKVVLFDFT